MPGPSNHFFTRRVIPVHGIPPAVLAKARQIIASLEAGTPYWQLHGKRLHWNRSVISSAVGRSWSIRAHDNNGRVEARQVLSHSSYNHRLSMF
jgi:hypothetical protein